MEYENWTIEFTVGVGSVRNGKPDRSLEPHSTHFACGTGIDREFSYDFRRSTVNKQLKLC
jgi:hypothetical protein